MRYVSLASRGVALMWKASSSRQLKLHKLGTAAAAAAASFYPRGYVYARNASSDSSGGVTTTERLQTEMLFESRNYIFRTTKNIRSYEWETKETEELWDDLMDEVNRNPVQDYELQQIVLVPAEWDIDMYGVGSRFDVHDGQQRLVTLSLLFAAFRDALRQRQVHVGGDEHDHNDLIRELTTKLNPPKSKKDPILRIELRQREGTMLQRILQPCLMDDDSHRVNLPETKDRKSLTKTDLRVIQNYELLLEKSMAMPVEDLINLIQYVQERVYMLVCTSKDPKIARNIVMGQGKGKQNEPIDDFKGQVCFQKTLNEQDQDNVFHKWDALTADDAVGRDVLADACLLMVKATLRERVKKNDDINMMEKWLKLVLDKKHTDGEIDYDGKDFFEEFIVPASYALKDFRSFTVDVVSRFPNASTNHTLSRKISMQLRFLARFAGKLTIAKEIEMVVIPLLLQNDLSAAELEKRLVNVDLLALWMIFAKPSPIQRHQRCFAALDAFMRPDHQDMFIPNVLTTKDLSVIREKLESTEFGASVPGKNTAKAILERLNGHILCSSSQSAMPHCENLELEHILPRAADEDYWRRIWPDTMLRDKWMHRLGNLALFNQKSNARASNKSFSTKKDFYKESPYPLTNKLQSVDTWNEDSVRAQHTFILHKAYEVWGL